MNIPDWVKVAVPVWIACALQVGAMIWWAGGIEQRVTNLEAGARGDYGGRISTMEERTRLNERRLDWLEALVQQVVQRSEHEPVPPVPELPRHALVPPADRLRVLPGPWYTTALN